MCREKEIEIKDYVMLEWQASQFIDHIETILIGANNHINKIGLENGSTYLVPELFYLAAKYKLKQSE